MNLKNYPGFPRFMLTHREDGSNRLRTLECPPHAKDVGGIDCKYRIYDFSSVDPPREGGEQTGGL